MTPIITLAGRPEWAEPCALLCLEPQAWSIRTTLFFLNKQHSENEFSFDDQR